MCLIKTNESASSGTLSCVARPPHLVLGRNQFEDEHENEDEEDEKVRDQIEDKVRTKLVLGGGARLKMCCR